MKKFNPHALGLSIGLYFALLMLVMSIVAWNGYYLEAWEVMMKFHLFASLSFAGVIIGIIEAGLCGYLCGLFVGWFYNKLS